MLNTSFNMFKLPTWVGKYNLFINAFKVRGILNSSEKIKVHSNLIKRCVKNVPIRIYKRKTILELENIESRVLNFCESTRIKVIRIFSVSPAHFEGYEGTPICVWNKARGILNSSEKIKVHSNLIKRCVKNVPIRIYKRKTILELENIESRVLNFCESTRIKVIRIFSVSPAHFEGYEGTPICVWNKARGILNSSEKKLKCTAI